MLPPVDVNSDLILFLATGDPDGRVGELEATFLSSKSKFTFSESSLSSNTFSVSYVSTAQNFDIFKWIFEGGYTSGLDQARRQAALRLLKEILMIQPHPVR